MKYTTSTYSSLKNNVKHLFAKSQSWSIFRSNAVYTMIPKNACTTFRYSIARDNGFIHHESDLHWIHENNDAFIPDDHFLIRANYTFVMLRCPYARLASAYIDKLAGVTQEAWKYHRMTNSKTSPFEVTFEMFIKSLKIFPIKAGNVHWKPQTDFLVYREYDDYLQFEKIEESFNRIKEKIDLPIIDTRYLSKHTTQFLNVINCANDGPKLTPLEILNLKKQNQIPDPKSLYNDELIEIVSTAYATDIDLYKNVFGENMLMFS